MCSLSTLMRCQVQEEVYRTIRTLIKPTPITQSSTDKCQGVLLLNARKEVVVLSKRLLDACPPARNTGASAYPPSPDTPVVVTSQDIVKLDRLLCVTRQIGDGCGGRRVCTSAHCSACVYMNVGVAVCP